jgi:hypothetical protein
VNYTKYVIRTRARFRLTTHLLECGATEPNAVKKVKVTKKGEAQQPRKNGVREPRGYSTGDASIPPIDVNTNRKYFRMILWVCLSAAFLGFGTLASGLLSQEENVGSAIVLFLGGLTGAAGCIFFFYLFLREISPKARGPFISTLQ